MEYTTEGPAEHDSPPVDDATYGAAPEPVDVETINRWLLRLLEAKRLRDRVKDVYAHRIRGLDSNITYLEDRLRVFALQWRGETGETSIPLTAGTIAIRVRPARVEASPEAIAIVGATLNLAQDRRYLQQPEPVEWWNRKAILALLEFPKKPGPDGSAAAFHRETGAVFDGIRKVWAAEGDWTISIKPGEVATIGEDETQDEVAS